MIHKVQMISVKMLQAKPKYYGSFLVRATGRDWKLPGGLKWPVFEENWSDILIACGRSRWSWKSSGRAWGRAEGQRTQLPIWTQRCWLSRWVSAHPGGTPSLGACPVSQGMGFQLVLILAFLHTMYPFSLSFVYTLVWGCNSNHSGCSLVCFLLCWLGSRSGTSH